MEVNEDAAFLPEQVGLGADRGKAWHLPVKNTNSSIGGVFGAFLLGKPRRMAFYVFYWFHD